MAGGRGVSACAAFWLALADFAAKYKYFFGPNGIPAMGRSLCYRAAAPVPLLMAAQDGSSGVSVGEARRARYLTWGFLVRNGAYRIAAT